MKYKVSELEGALLDAAVAKAEDILLVFENFERLDYSAINEIDGRYYKPSSDWRIGGPIIERKRISFYRVKVSDKEVCRAGIGEVYGIAEQYVTDDGPDVGCAHEQTGPTELIAAMRACVASEFGEEVELP